MSEFENLEKKAQDYVEAGCRLGAMALCTEAIALASQDWARRVRGKLSPVPSS